MVVRATAVLAVGEWAHRTVTEASSAPTKSPAKKPTMAHTWTTPPPGPPGGGGQGGHHDDHVDDVHGASGRRGRPPGAVRRESGPPRLSR